MQSGGVLHTYINSINKDTQECMTDRGSLKHKLNSEIIHSPN